eukprot:TRINITY_DN29112_c0_g3_i1.p1 TRINITY_DN29112_c0_g3~~TRINITY_DN29112_c0_g3_i1.p1  ORF type:complete len:2840 (-),score=470.85 TRINITY_DN29112_c0_g3_i1:83-7426(-)
MEKAGWKFNHQADEMFRPPLDNNTMAPGDWFKDAYWGFHPEYALEVSLPLHNDGTVTVVFGNNVVNGSITLYIGDRFAWSTNNQSVTEEVTLSFKDGDILRFVSQGPGEAGGVLVIRSVRFECEECGHDVSYANSKCTLNEPDTKFALDSFDCTQQVLAQNDLIGWSRPRAVNLEHRATLTLGTPHVVYKVKLYVRENCPRIAVQYYMDELWNDACILETPAKFRYQSVLTCENFQNLPISMIRIVKPKGVVCYDGGSALKLTGVRMFGCDGEGEAPNIALGARVRSSSALTVVGDVVNLSAPAGGAAATEELAQLATDGLENRCIQTADKDASWIRVDLGRDRRVRSVATVVRTASPRWQRSNWVIRVGNAGDETDAVCRRNVDALGSGNGSAVVRCQEPLPLGRHVSIWSARGLEVCEIMVRGDEMPSEPYYPQYTATTCACGANGPVRGVPLSANEGEDRCVMECTDWDYCTAYVFDEVANTCFLFYRPETGMAQGAFTSWSSGLAPCEEGGFAKCMKKTVQAVKYVRYERKTCSKGITIDKWSSGTNWFLPNGVFPRAQSCKDFCDTHWAQCTGFVWEESSKTCTWLHGACDLQNSYTATTYMRKNAGIQCTPSQCRDCGCSCTCPCTNCQCDSQTECPDEGVRTCCRERQNLALGKPTACSSCFQYAKAEKLVDGRTAEGEFSNNYLNACAITSNGKDHWMRVDLTAYHRVRTVRLYGRSAPGLSTVGWNIRVGSTGDISDTMCAEDNGALNDGWTRATCGSPRPIGRYVTVRSSSALVLCELEVYGDPAPEFDDNGVSAGKYLGVNFHLIRPYVNGTSVLYFLDQSGDGEMVPTGVDKVALSKLERFMFDSTTPLSDANAAIFAGGYRFRILSSAELPSLIKPASWDGWWYWTSTSVEDLPQPADTVDKCPKKNHWRVYQEGFPLPMCEDTDDEERLVALEVLGTPTNAAGVSPGLAWHLAMPGDDCRTRCAQVGMTCSDITFQEYQQTLYSKTEAARAAGEDLSTAYGPADVNKFGIDGLPGMCKMSAKHTPENDEDRYAMPLFYPNGDCRVIPTDGNVASGPSCVARPADKVGRRICPCERKPDNLGVRFSLAHATDATLHIERRELREGGFAFAGESRESFIFEGVPEQIRGATLFAMPRLQVPSGKLRLSVTIPVQVFVFGVQRLDCGFSRLQWEEMLTPTFVLKNARKPERHPVRIGVWSKRVAEFEEITVDTICAGGVVVKEDPNIACADGTDDVRFVPGKVVGCDASWIDPGVKKGESACSPGFRVCSSGEAAENLGLTRAACETLPPAGTFYATRQAEEIVDDIWGCGKDGDDMPFNHSGKAVGVLNMRLGNHDHGPWRYMSRYSDQELAKVIKTGVENGGVMCCAGKKSGSSRDWEDPKPLVWSNLECALLSQPLTSAADEVDMCKKECDETDGCTAINWNTIRQPVDVSLKRCELRECKLPMKMPHTSRPHWEGYNIAKDTGNCPSAGKTSSYCTHTAAWCEYSVRKADGSDDSCQDFCERLSMKCLGSWPATSSGSCDKGDAAKCFVPRADSVCRCEALATKEKLCSWCALGKFWCKELRAMKFTAVEYCPLTIEDDEWVFSGTETGVGCNEKAGAKCDYTKYFCAGPSGDTFGEPAAQLKALREAIANGGVHPNSKAGRSGECIFSDCHHVVIEGSPKHRANGVYVPFGDCDDAHYGKAEFGNEWTAYKNLRTGATIEWRWVDDDNHGWAVMFNGDVLLYNQLDDPKLFPQEAWRQVGQRHKYTAKCTKVMLDEFRGFLEDRFTNKIDVTNIAAEGAIWSNANGRPLPPILPRSMKYGTIVRPPWHSNGTYGFRVSERARVQVILGCYDDATLPPVVEPNEKEAYLFDHFGMIDCLAIPATDCALVNKGLDAKLMKRGPFTVEALIRLRPLANGSSLDGGIVAWGKEEKLGDSLEFRVLGGKLVLAYTGPLENVTDLVVDVPLEVHTWYFVVATWDGVLSRIYVNGDLVASRLQPNSLITGPEPWFQDNFCACRGDQEGPLLPGYMALLNIAGAAFSKDRILASIQKMRTSIIFVNNADTSLSWHVKDIKLFTHANCTGSIDLLSAVGVLYTRSDTDSEWLPDLNGHLDAHIDDDEATGRGLVSDVTGGCEARTCAFGVKLETFQEVRCAQLMQAGKKEFEHRASHVAVMQQVYSVDSSSDKVEAPIPLFECDAMFPEEGWDTCSLDASPPTRLRISNGENTLKWTSNFSFFQDPDCAGAAIDPALVSISQARGGEAVNASGDGTETAATSAKGNSTLPFDEPCSAHECSYKFSFKPPEVSEISCIKVTQADPPVGAMEVTRYFQGNYTRLFTCEKLSKLEYICNAKVTPSATSTGNQKPDDNTKVPPLGRAGKFQQIVETVGRDARLQLMLQGFLPSEPLPKTGAYCMFMKDLPVFTRTYEAKSHVEVKLTRNVHPSFVITYVDNTAV